MFRKFYKEADDDRVITMIPGYSEELVNHKKNGITGKVSIDEFGFRRGSYKIATLQSLTKNFIFIGDSVPYGWEIDDLQTIPSHFWNIIEQKRGHEDMGVINAAIPSYSLKQSVARYMKEIDGKFNVYGVYLQFYDPVGQLILFGKNWREDINWATERKLLVKIFPERERFFGLERKSSLVAIVNRAINKHLGERVYYSTFSCKDTDTVQKFKKHIDKSLLTLLSVMDHNSKLYIAPLTIGPSTIKRMPYDSVCAVKILNDELVKYSKENKRVIFIDTVELFGDDRDESKYFTDGLHLSGEGSRLVAQYLYDRVDFSLLK
ncbi:MAG: hypothetical protein HQL65_04255 [Magnetococcales bacterium]|nr:hypothetical protein [Magnetococcales bacterium]